jgi:hypothetical protein
MLEKTWTSVTSEAKGGAEDKFGFAEILTL